MNLKLNSLLPRIASSEIQMETGNEFLNFNLIKNETHHTKDHFKLVTLPSLRLFN